MSFRNAEDIDGALQRLGKRLAYEYAGPISLVVCGGSALNVLNIASRTTRDVDVLATVEETAGGFRLRHDQPLPVEFSEVVSQKSGGISDCLKTGSTWGRRMYFKFMVHRKA